ncbi:hypothetical protein XCCB100_4022 [Xanthomonas campestris pv. campestris]|uniref:Uncharacterized protein n=1 Tax=Xanthomonas campestris pv. campestris (strain B100) TaxID=509169 RepID=B0RXK3_XANCB|nr:hypothetical protein XCCB100_4022 [Xanthomonas campestris pv. campestris]
MGVARQRSRTILAGSLDVKKYEFHDIHNYWESPNCYRITRVQKVPLHIFARRIERLKQENPAEAGFSLGATDRPRRARNGCGPTRSRCIST